MKIYITAFFICLFSAFFPMIHPVQSSAQEYPMRLFDDSQGLGSLSVMAILQSEAGYIWIGTHEGLFRFDGKQFKEYKYNDRSIWYVMHLAEAEDGSVWVAGDVGLYRITNQKIELIADTGFPSNGGFYCVFEDDQKRIWFGTSAGGPGIVEDGVLRYLPELSELRIFRFTQDENGDLLAGGSAGLFRIDERLNILPILESVEVRDFTKGENGTFWAATLDGVYHFKDNEIIARYGIENGLPDNEVWQITSAADGSMYATTPAGLAVINRDKEISVINEDYGLINHQLQAVEIDREGNVLLGTSYSGMYMLFNKFFNHFPLTGPEKQTRVTSITSDDDNNLWLSTWSDGFFVLNEERQVILNAGIESGLPDDRITSVAPLNADSTLIGTYRNGLYLYSRGVARPLRNSPVPQDGYIMYLSRMRDGSVWISEHGSGLYRFQNGTIDRPVNDTRAEGLIVVKMYEDSLTNTIWMALRNGGIASFRDDVFTVYGVDDGLANQLVFNVEPDETGLVWISHHSGLSTYDGADFHNYGEDSPLHGEFVLSMKADHTGAMWFGLVRDLVRSHKGEFTRFSLNDGLASSRFEDASSYRDAEGFIWFGTYNGALRIDPSAYSQRNTVPPVHIASVEIIDRHVNPTDQIRVNYNENFITITLNGISFSRPDNIRYRYRLHREGETWFNTDQPRIQLASLSPGDYSFEAQATVDGENWSTVSAQLYISVQPPYWQTRWFRFGILAGLAAVGWAAYHYRVNNLLKLERLRTRIASDLHDDVGSTLTRISLHSELLINRTSPKKNEHYLNSISQSSRALLTTMSDIVWSIDARSDYWGDLITRMREFSGNTLPDAGITLDFKVEGIDEERKIAVDLRQNLYLIFKEAVINAAKHSGAAKVRVELIKKGNGLSMKISDDGQGQIPAHANGNGLKNMKMRAERINGSLIITNGSGTVVELTAEI